MNVADMNASLGPVSAFTDLMPTSLGPDYPVTDTEDVISNQTDISGTWTSATGDGELPTFWEYTMSLQVQAVAGLVIVLLGLTGNILCITTLSLGGMVNSTAIYLINLAASDLTITVVGQMLRVFPRALTGFDTGSQHPWICKSWFFINHSAKTISGWTLVAVTIERTLVVYMPLRVRHLCTNARAKLAILLIDLLCMCCYLHYFWTYGAVFEVNEDGKQVLVAGCTIVKDNPDIIDYMMYVRPWQDFIIRSAAPFACLLICNCLIIFKLIRMRAKRMKMVQGSANQSDDGQMASMTAMLLTVSFAHLICISPMQIMYLIDKSDPFGWVMDERWKAQVALRWSFAIDVYYANHAINFFLYCISGKEFRKGLRATFAKLPLCRRCCAEPPKEIYSPESTVSTVSSNKAV